MRRGAVRSAYAVLRIKKTSLTVYITGPADFKYGRNGMQFWTTGVSITSRIIASHKTHNCINTAPAKKLLRQNAEKNTLEKNAQIVRLDLFKNEEL